MSVERLFLPNKLKKGHLFVKEIPTGEIHQIIEFDFMRISIHVKPSIILYLFFIRMEKYY